MSADLKREIRASEARQQKQMDELKEEFKDVRRELRASEVRHSDALKASEARQKQQMEDLKKDFKASEARQQKQMDELKRANELLAGKVDQLPDVFPAAKA